MPVEHFPFVHEAPGTHRKSPDEDDPPGFSEETREADQRDDEILQHCHHQSSVVDIFGYYVPDAAAFALGIAAVVIAVMAAAIILDRLR